MALSVACSSMVLIGTPAAWSSDSGGTRRANAGVGDEWRTKVVPMRHADLTVHDKTAASA